MIQGRWLNRFIDDRGFVVLRPDILESCSDLMKSPPLLRDPSANPSNQTIILSSPASISVCKGESRTHRRSSANLKAVLHHVKSSWTAVMNEWWNYLRRQKHLDHASAWRRCILENLILIYLYVIFQLVSFCYLQTSTSAIRLCWT